MPPETAYYVHTYTKVSSGLENKELEHQNPVKNLQKALYSLDHPKEAERLQNCGQKWMAYTCEKGHTMYRQLGCLLPYCPECGKLGGLYGRKRQKRVKGYLLGFPAIGHYVFTLPKEISASLPSYDKISKLYKLAWKVLNEFFDAEAAVVALHLTGEKSSGLHIHFDCSFPILHTAGDCMINQGILDLARQEWTSGVNKIFNGQGTQMVGHYNFTNTLEQQYHLIKYVTRSTIEADKFIELSPEEQAYCLGLNRHINIRYFGQFVGKKKPPFLAKYRCTKILERAEADKDPLEDHICPVCGYKMKPGRRAAFMDDIPLLNFERYDRHTLIDREIGACLRDREKKKAAVSLEDRLFSLEMAYLKGAV